MTDLDWNDIQGNILRGYGFDHARHLVLAATSQAAAREWLARIRATVTPASPWDETPDVTLNVAFTHRGLRAFGVPPAMLSDFAAPFRDGMQARAVRHLGDVGHDDPGGWDETGIHDPRAHVLVMLHSREPEACAARVASLLRDADRHELALVHDETLASLPPPGNGSRLRVEHFGFVDGISQPAVEGAVTPSAIPGNGTPLPDGTWRAVRAGEFVVGYPDEEEERPPLPGPEALVHNGSFLVYRKLEQDVAAFRRFLLAESERHAVSPELIGAKLLGRRTDGTLLVPDDADPAGDHDAGHDADGLPRNDVRFAADRLGHACPIGSHVRRANPRDGLGFNPELVSRHRLLRRGMPYGPPLPEGVTTDDEVCRGLLFVAYCAHISRQYEVMQREWMNDGNIAGLGHTADPLAGGSALRRFAFHVPDRRPLFLSDVPRFVRPVAGEYLLQPGLSALENLARGLTG